MYQTMTENEIQEAAQKAAGKMRRRINQRKRQARLVYDALLAACDRKTAEDIIRELFSFEVKQGWLDELFADRPCGVMP